jgi:hypothetical protein
MKASEVIQEIENLIKKHGDKDFHIYLSYSKTTQEPTEVTFDHGEDDIYIGVYA